jgi:hypothetical protein
MRLEEAEQPDTEVYATAAGAQNPVTAVRSMVKQVLFHAYATTVLASADKNKLLLTVFRIR